MKEAPSSNCLVCGTKLSGEPIALCCVETIEKLPPIAVPASRELIVVQDPAHKTPLSDSQLYQSPLDRMREKRAREREAREQIEAEKERKHAEERRLLATRKVGALLPPPPPVAGPAPASSTLVSLSGDTKRRTAEGALSGTVAGAALSHGHAHAHAHSQAKRLRPEEPKLRAPQTSAARNGHLASLFSATLKKAV